MINLIELKKKRKRIEGQIRKVERDVLEPYIGRRKCLSTTFPHEPPGTLEAMVPEELPEKYTAEQLREVVQQDERWKALKKELDEVQSEFEEYLEEKNLKDDTYKAQIKAIKQDHGESLTAYEIAKFVDCSRDYVDSIFYSRSRDETISRQIRRKVIERDTVCVRCGADSSLEIHHITPVHDDGESILANLAVLCNECHLDAHGGSWDGDTQYETRPEFWDWAKENKGKQ